MKKKDWFTNTIHVAMAWLIISAILVPPLFFGNLVGQAVWKWQMHYSIILLPITLPLMLFLAAVGMVLAMFLLRLAIQFLTYPIWVIAKMSGKFKKWLERD